MLPRSITNNLRPRLDRGPHTFPSRRQQRGLTLLESAIALAVFSYILASLTTLTMSSMKLNSNAKRYTMASALAQSKIEDLRAGGYIAAASSSSAESLDLSGNPSAATAFSRSWTVSAATPIANSKTVAVNVAWTDNQGSHQSVVNTILVN